MHINLVKWPSSPSPPSLCIFPSTINTLPKLFSISTSTGLFKPARLVPHLSVAASFELYEDEEQQQPSYSPDLKLVVGNLPHLSLYSSSPQSSLT
ncbi:hypothetical protein Hanom_Chr15g01391401 [Helianthus anomalus]